MPLKMNDTKNRFKFTKEIILKLTAQKKSISHNPLPFYMRNPFKNERHKKIIHFNFIKEIPLKFTK